jgi:hypothetical protein
MSTGVPLYRIPVSIKAGENQTVVLGGRSDEPFDVGTVTVKKNK